MCDEDASQVSLHDALRGGKTTSSTKSRFMCRPFQGPPRLQRQLTVPFIPKENPFSLTKSQCMATVLSDLHLLGDAVIKAGIAVRDTGIIADPLESLAAFLTDSYKHLKSFWDDACSDNDNTRGLEDIVVKVLLEQMAITARTLEEQCKHISDHALHLARQGRMLDEKGVNKVVKKATGRIQLEKKALDLAAEELQKQCKLANKQLAATTTKLSVVPGRDETAALLKSQREQLRLQKLLSQRQLQLKVLREQHELVKSGMLATQKGKQHVEHEVEISKKRGTMKCTCTYYVMLLISLVW